MWVSMTEVMSEFAGTLMDAIASMNECPMGLDDGRAPSTENTFAEETYG